MKGRFVRDRQKGKQCESNVFCCISRAVRFFFFSFPIVVVVVFFFFFSNPLFSRQLRAESSRFLSFLFACY